MKTLTRIADTWSRVRPLQGQRRALLVLIVGLVLTSAAVLAVRSHENDQRRIEFERRAHDLSRALRTALELPLETLRLIPPLFDGSDPVERAEFIGFVGPALARHPGVAYLEWAPEVLAQERDDFERRARAQGFEGFMIGEPGPDGALRPAPARARYLPLLYVVPEVAGVVGLDLAFEPSRRDLALRALSDGLLTVSPHFRLIEDPPHVRSIAVYAPLLRPRAPSDEPHGARRGVAVLIFRLEPLVQQVLGDKLDQLELVLLDETAVGQPALLFESQHDLWQRDEEEFAASFVQHFEFHTRRWAVRFLAARDALPKRLLSPLVAAFGLLLSLASTLLIGASDLVRRLRSEVHAAQQIGQYRLIRKLGEGGMGTVYEAEHALLRRPTAVKVISAHAVGQDVIERFEREVKATSQLTHPNTVAVYDYGRAPSGVFYYAMEYLPGANAEQLVRRTGPLPPARVVHLLQQACASLAEAHEAGLIHRDVKPANLMVCERGGIADFVKVLDFGLVKDVRHAQANSLSGAIIGTPHYMAPEVVLGMGATPATDLYALGAVAYYLLTSYEVFPDRAMLAVLAQHVSEPPPPLRERTSQPPPEQLEALILRCLAKKPNERPVSARALADELARLVEEGHVARWTQTEARAFWREHGEALRNSLADAARSGATPWGETLVVDLEERGRPHVTRSESGVEPARRAGS